MRLHQYIKQISFYGIGLVATKALSIVMLPIITKLLNPAEFGTMEILQTFINVLSTILCIGQSEAIFRFGGMADTTKSVDKICINAGMLVFMASLIFGCLIILFERQISSLLPGNTNAWQIFYLGLLMIPSNVLVIQLDWLRLKENIPMFVWMNLVRAFVQAGLVIIGLYAGYGVTGIMFASVISNLIILLYITPSQLKGGMPWDTALQKRLLFYGLPLIITGIADFLMMSLNIWWLGYAIGAASMAQFALAMKFSLVTFLLMQPFSLWWFPKRFKHIKTENDRVYCAQISELGVTLTLLIVFSITLASSLYIYWFIPASYHYAIGYLPLSCFVLALKPASDMMNTGLLLEKTDWFMWINCLMASLTVIGYYFFIPIYQAWGALFVLFFVLSLRWVSCLYLSQKELYLPYRYVKLIIFIVAVFLCEASIWAMSTPIDYIFKGGALWVTLVIMAYYLKLLPNWRQLIVKKTVGEKDK